MSISAYSNWNQRDTDTLDQQEPYRRYVFICEGENTEIWYFKKLIDLRKNWESTPLSIYAYGKSLMATPLYPHPIVSFDSPMKRKDSPS